MKLKLNPTASLAAFMVLLLAGCFSSARPGLIPVSGKPGPTAVMQTLYAQLTAYAPVTATPRPPRTILTPAPTPFTALASPGLGFPPSVLTIPPAFPVATTTAYANCRTGPGVNYPAAAVLPAGGQYPLQGRLEDNTWWAVRIPGSAGGLCWVWAGVTAVTGDVSLLPLPPTPRPPAGTALPGNPAPLPGVATATPTPTAQPTPVSTVSATSTPQVPTTPPTPTLQPGPTATPQPTNTEKPKPTHKPTKTARLP